MESEMNAETLTAEAVAAYEADVSKDQLAQ
jgi:hypothetical protein